VVVDPISADTALAALLPGDARSAIAVDLPAVLNGGSGDPMVTEILGGVGALAASIDPDAITSALLAQTTDPLDGMFLLARVEGETIDDVAAGTAPTPDGTYGPSAHALYVDADGNHLALLPGGVLVAGARPVVESVLDVVDGTSPAGESAIAPFLDALPTDHHIGFVHGLPALFGDIAADRSLRGAAAMSGALDITGGNVAGELAFHTSNAAEFVETYNALDRNAQQADPPAAQPLTLGDPIVGDLGQVVVSVDADEFASRNTFKKLFVGMEAHDYAEDVFNPGNKAWYDLLVKSEPTTTSRRRPARSSSGGSSATWRRRGVRGRTSSPPGSRIAPTRFLESDPPEGGYFLALNLYNSWRRVMIVGGARAEWDVFVDPPDGADPERRCAPPLHGRRRAAEEVSADSGTCSRRPSRSRTSSFDGDVVSSVQRIEGDRTPPSSSRRSRRPTRPGEVARFTREMAIGNDYIYWAHGVSTGSLQRHHLQPRRLLSSTRRRSPSSTTRAGRSTSSPPCPTPSTT
jgi:hypothetical protein